MADAADDSSLPEAAETYYRIPAGIRFRRQTGGEAMLLVPDGIVALDEETAAILERADGATGCPLAGLRADVRARLERLVVQGFIMRSDVKGAEKPIAQSSG